MKVFLDDIRMPDQCLSYMHYRIGKLNPIYAESWEIVRNYESFVNCVEKNFEKITHISFDHDLADIYYDPITCREIFAYNSKTGYDCAVWLKNFYTNKGLNMPIVFIHSESEDKQKLFDFFNQNI
jgi:hypothetical protein